MRRTFRCWLGLCGLMVLESGCDGQVQGRSRPLAFETHAIVDGSRDPLIVTPGRLLRVHCIGFDADGFVAPSGPLAPTLRSGIGRARLRREGWLELLLPGRVEVVCPAPGALVRGTVVLVAEEHHSAATGDASSLTLAPQAR